MKDGKRVKKKIVDAPLTFSDLIFILFLILKQGGIGVFQVLLHPLRIE